MIIKTTDTLTTPRGTIVSGASFRAVRDKVGFRINSGEYSGIGVPESSAIILSNVVLDEDGKIPRNGRFA
ncbi:hypothetical protein [Paenibacillus sp. FSL L8-0708]|jgi:hypothetical protein|uniref:hypothetical protein n=1 Tax=Paenibacillus sp. FSL L8-0708 TaxID=2975311 RepID=UPI0030F8ADF5